MLDFLVVVASRVDCDLARLHGLRHFADQVDVEQSAVEGCALHLDVVGQIEDAAERKRRDTLIQVLVTVLIRLAAFNGKRVLLGRDGDLVWSKAGNGQ